VSVFVRKHSSEDSISGVGSGIDATSFVDTMSQGRPTANDLEHSPLPLGTASRQVEIAKYR